MRKSLHDSLKNGEDVIGRGLRNIDTKIYVGEIERIDETTVYLSSGATIFAF